MNVRSLSVSLILGAMLPLSSIAGLNEDIAAGQTAEQAVQNVLDSNDYLPGAALDAITTDPSNADAVIKAAVATRPDMGSEIAAAMARTYARDCAEPPPQPDHLNTAMTAVSALGEDILQDAAIAAANSNVCAAGPAVGMIAALASQELAEETASVIAAVVPAAQGPMLAYFSTNLPNLATSFQASINLAQGESDILRGLQTSSEIKAGTALPPSPPSPF